MDALRFRAESLARGAEIDQHRVAVGGNHDVGRLDVAVQEAGLVHFGDAVEQRIEEFVDFGFRERARLLQDLGEARAMLVSHHQVGGAVGLEVAVDPHDVVVVEAHQRARFVAEPFQAPPEGLGIGGDQRMHAGAGRRSRRNGARQVFLDRDRAADHRLGRLIGNAEAARAEHALDAVAFEFVSFR